jgi:hypothetical protein
MAGRLFGVNQSPKEQGNAMPAKILGMIGTQMEGVAVHLIKGQISRDWVIDFTRSGIMIPSSLDITPRRPKGLASRSTRQRTPNG